MLGDLVRRLLSLRLLALWGIASFFMAAAGPFGTYESLALSQRLAFWAGAMGLAFVAGVVSFSASEHCCAARPWGVRYLVTIALFTLLLVPLLREFAVDMHGHLMGLGPMALVVALVPAALGLVKYLWLAPEVPAPVETEAPAPDAPLPRLIERLDPEMRGTIFYLRVRDHYVDVLTERGTSSVLMRFSDAMTELDGIEGMQVHRSHWVARAAVTGHGMRDGKVYLTLVGGQEVPVSRSFLERARAGGYL